MKKLFLSVMVFVSIIHPSYSQTNVDPDIMVLISASAMRDADLKYLQEQMDKDAKASEDLLKETTELTAASKSSSTLDRIDENLKQLAVLEGRMDAYEELYERYRVELKNYQDLIQSKTKSSIRP